MLRLSFALSLLVLGLGVPQRAQAHFLWVVTQPGERAESVRVYFGEDASPDDPDLLDRVAAAKAWVVGGRRGPLELKLSKKDDALVASIRESHAGGPVVLRHTYGVISRGESTFLLNYYAKTYPSVVPGSWQEVADAERLPLEVVPSLQGQSLVLTVLWQGKPLPGAELTIEGGELDDVVEGTTSEKGAFETRLPADGLYSIRAKHVEQKSGEHDGKAYAESRHYSTLALRYDAPELAPSNDNLTDLPKGVTSFGGAVIGDWLYVYGGHYGQAHHYSREGQSGDFLRLNLAEPKAWESLPGGPKLTGVGLVAYAGKLYRVGGFTADNGDDDDERLISQAGFAEFDPQTREWTDLPPLPEPRSSLDAAVLGDTLYVAGGWNMQPGQDTVWHDTAWSVDLSAEALEWKPVSQPPFRRRAVALAAFDGKLYCLGGMQEKGGITTRVGVYDPQTKQWSEGPALLGNGMDGFGASTFAAGGSLYATTMAGAIQRLSRDGTSWEFVGQLAEPRFFHRLLPWQGDRLIVVGGAHMSVGKLTSLELLEPAVRATAAK